MARELGWYPSSSARALSRARTGAIGLVLSRDPAAIGTELGRDLGVCERWAGEGRVDGVILFDQQEDDARLPLVTRLGLPAVLNGVPASLVVSVPVVIGFLLLQRYFVAGLTAGAVK
jgi:DNA-binding LacI/PurR family transcriptional regulator